MGDEKSSVGQHWGYLLDTNPRIVRTLNEATEVRIERAKLRINETLEPVKGERGAMTVDSLAW